MNGDVKTKIIKRNGEEVTFDIDKIINAITKANEEVSKLHQMNEYQIMAIAEKVADQVKKQHEKAIHILTENRAKLDELAQYLYEKETITGEEFMNIVNAK